MLRQFHFIDQNGKDQGINVRNRSKELTELLSDVDRIRGERKKARANRNKFGGVEGGAMGGGMSSGSRYGGFGSESAGYGGYSGGVYGDGGGFGGNTSEFQDSTSRRDKFEEYDEGDDGTTASTTARRKPEATSSTARRETQKSAPPKKKEPEIDILSFDVDDIPPKTPPKDFTSNGKKASSNPMDNGFGSLSAGGANEEDDFDDFQSATPNPQTTSKPSGLGLPLPTPSSNTTTQFAAPKPISSSQGANLNDLVGFNSISPAPSLTGITSPPASTFTTSPPPPSAFQSPPPLSTMQQQQQPKPTGYRAAQPNYYTSVQIQPSNSTQPGMSKPTLTSNPSYSSTTTLNKPAGGAKPSAGDAFSNLWSTASSTAGIKKTNTPSNAGPNLASMAKEKASQGMWGASPAPTMTGSMASGQKIQSNGGQQQKVGGGLDDLLG